jgi:hypothetical protein
MDSPLDWFRRNSKYLLPIFGILIIVIFLLSDSISNFMRGQRPDAGQNRDTTVATWKDGPITESELQNNWSNFIMTSRIMMRLHGELFKLQVPAIANSPRLDLLQQVSQRQFFGDFPLYSGLDGEGIRFEQVVSPLCYEKLMYEASKELGINVSMDDAKALLDSYRVQFETDKNGKTTSRALHQVPAGKVTSMIEEISKQNPAFNQLALIENLRRMMAANQAYIMLLEAQSNPAINSTPMSRFANYRRVKQQVSLQAIPLPVETFISQVENPSDAELEKFFNEHKSKMANPLSPEVGLLQPVRASFQYVMINRQKLIDAYKPSISDKEIADYYEANKIKYKKEPKLPEVKLPEVETPKAPTDPMTPATEAKPADNKPADKAPESKPESKETPAPMTTEPKSPEVKTPEPKAPAAEPKADAPKATEAAPKQSSTAKGPFRFVNFQAADSKATDSKAVDSKSADTKPVEPAQPATSNETKPADAKPADAQPATTEKPAEAVIEYEPLDKVRDQIRNEIAQNKAAAKVSELLGKMQAKMKDYSDKRFLEIDEEGDPDAKAKYPPFDMIAARDAVDPTIEAVELKQITIEEFRKLPVSRTQAFENLNTQDRTLGALIFIPQAAAPYQIIRPISISGDAYLIWKTEQLAPSEGSLKDPKFKETVILAWKQLKARKLAEKQANDYLKIAQTKKQSLKELFDNKEIPISPSMIGRFSWVVPTANPQGNASYKLSEVSGLEKVGDEFMAGLFELKAGEYAVLMNGPQTIAYLVQVVEIDDPQTLLTNFMQDTRTADGWSQFASAVDGSTARQENDGFEKALFDRFQFKIDPEYRARRSKAK